MNTEKYLERINWDENVTPTVGNLIKLQRAHLLYIPFENLDIHYHHPIMLDVSRFFDKIVLQKRGGFCYELNGLFHALLIQLGYIAKIISARVYTKENTYGPDYDHLAIIVTIDNKKYLADVGFGEFAFKPLEIKPGIIQKDSRGDFVVDEYEERGYLRVSKIEQAKRLPEYIFTTEKKSLNEFEAMCHYHQSNPASHFVQRKLISKPTENGRITLTGNYLKITKGCHLITEEFLDETGFENNLLKYFGIDCCILK